MRPSPVFTCNLLVLLLATSASATAQAKPLRVSILAGQSNMEGHAQIETFDYLGDDPATALLLMPMRGQNGQPRVCRERGFPTTHVRAMKTARGTAS